MPTRDRRLRPDNFPQKAAAAPPASPFLPAVSSSPAPTSSTPALSSFHPSTSLHFPVLRDTPYPRPRPPSFHFATDLSLPPSPIVRFPPLLRHFPQYLFPPFPLHALSLITDTRPTARLSLSLSSPTSRFPHFSPY